MREIHDVLADDGLWVFEQSYMPTMLEKNSYDTVCHEHIEYYALAQIKWMADRVGFAIADVTFNAVNGGSFSVVVKKAAPGLRHAPIVDRIVRDEVALGLDTLRPFEAFAGRVAETKQALRGFLDNARKQGQTVGALGASTKGNVLLQYCGVTPADMAWVGEVNQEKWGRFTPGTNIPIVAEDELLAMNPRFLLVLPWHFRDHFVAAKKFKGKSLVFPLPKLEIVDVP